MPVISLVADDVDSIMTDDDSEWRQETRRDLAQAATRLDSLASSVSGTLTREQVRALWLSYLLVEKSVAFVKIELEEENPGRFISSKPYSVPDERQAIGFALKHLNAARESLDAGGLGWCLKEMRESRNYLRVLLKNVRRQRERARKAG